MDSPPRSSPSFPPARRSTSPTTLSQGTQTQEFEDTALPQSPLAPGSPLPQGLLSGLPAHIAIVRQSILEGQLEAAPVPESSQNPNQSTQLYLTMGRHSSPSQSDPTRSQQYQLISPGTSNDPRAMSQVSPGFIFVNFLSLCIDFCTLSFHQHSFDVAFMLFPMSSHLFGGAIQIPRLVLTAL